MEEKQNSVDLIKDNEVADMLKINKRAVRYILEKDETFPRPIIISPRIRRWDRQEVVDWVYNREKVRHENQKIFNN